MPQVLLFIPISNEFGDKLFKLPNAPITRVHDLLGRASGRPCTE
jgi:hypothetical protein